MFSNDTPACDTCVSWCDWIVVVEMLSLFISNKVTEIISLDKNENLLELTITYDDAAVHLYYICSVFKL
jgi:hypothetical protein